VQSEPFRDSPEDHGPDDHRVGASDDNAAEYLYDSDQVDVARDHEHDE